MLKKGEWREGKFYPDNTPVEVPLRFRSQRNEPLHVLVARAMADISRNAEREGQESMEESEDFFVPDEPEVLDSRYTFTEMQEEEIRYAKQEALDIAREREENERTVNNDRTKERVNVHDGRAEGDRGGAGGSGEVGQPAGGKRRAAGNGGGRVSEGRGADRSGDAEGDVGAG